MTTEMKIRWATHADYEQLGQVMFDAVRNGPSFYSEAQRSAWTPIPRCGDQWNDRLSEQAIILQETPAEVCGFLSLAQMGYVDFAYIRPAFQGTGLFRKLYEHLEARALNERVRRLWTYASLMAQPAFSAVGFSVMAEEEVVIGGETFKRFQMEKILGD